MLCRIHWRDLLHDYVRPIQHLCSIQHSKTYALRAVTVKHIGRQKHKNWWSSSSIVKRVCGLLLYSCHRLGIVIPKPRNSRPVQGDAVSGLNELTDPVFPAFSDLEIWPPFPLFVAPGVGFTTWPAAAVLCPVAGRTWQKLAGRYEGRCASG